MKAQTETVYTARRWRDLLAEIPLMALLSAASAYPFVSALDLHLSIWQLLAACLVLVIPLSMLLFHTRTAILTGIAVSLLAMAATAILLFSRNETADSLRLEIDAFINWAIPYLKGIRTENLAYCQAMGLIFTAFITIPVCLFTVRHADAFAALLPGFATIAALFIIGHTLSMAALFAFLAVAMLYAAYGRFRRQSGAYPPGQMPSPAVFLASALPLALAVMTMAMILSSLIKIDPEWMKATREKLLHKESPVAEVIINQASGVSTSELGGVPAQNDTVLMKVISDSADVYLKGISKDVYTGHSWERSNILKSPFYADEMNFPDTVETTRRLIQSSEPNEQTRMDEEIRVEYVNFNSPIVYIPLKTEKVVLPDSVQPSLVGDDMVLLGTTEDAGFSYSATYLANNDALQDLLAKSRKGYYNRIGGSAEELFGEYAEAINNGCTRLPDSLPARVRELAAQITAGASNDYEKAKAIEAYLASNYIYTLTPGAFDKSRDFVDQFLFENRRGYCTYFATAMAVLLRCEGIPSRFVEGYVLPASKTDGAYQVTNRQGHAWAEAYFEGVGWLQFEPTAAYAGGARPTASKAVTPPASPSPSLQASTNPSARPVVQPGPDDNALVVLAHQWVLWIIAILLLFLALTATAFGLRKRAALRLVQMTSKETVIKVFGQCLQILSKCGYTLQNGEDLHDFARRAEKGCLLQARSLSRIMELFQLARFSTHDVNEEQKKQMLDAREKLLLACKKKLGAIQYGIFKWLWG